MRGRPRIHKGCTARIGGSDPELMPVAMEYRWQPDGVEEFALRVTASKTAVVAA
jgi:hypothetical protein